MRNIDRCEVTPERVYLSRRRFMRGAAALATAAALDACAQPGPEEPPNGSLTPEPVQTGPEATPARDELGDNASSYETITGYNNYYEFSMSKEGVARAAEQFQASPWALEVAGLVAKPRVFTGEELAAFPAEERIYRLRCVEGWSMVIPWLGFPLARLLDVVEPQAEARFVRFETVYRPTEMAEQRDSRYPWPYVEGLRLDEAKHDLTLLATGLYGKLMPAQNGAPIRLVVPWKYGFKSIKSIVRIELVASMPTTFWMGLAPDEYGFYANVNPDVPHPRWSQASERRIGEPGRRDTLPFNGYADEVAGLYAGMDLQANF